MKFAIVDDSMFSRMQLKNKLSELFPGSGFSEFADGQYAVEGITEGVFDYITMDLTMPRMDGIQALATLRSNGVTTPIFVISADIQASTMEKCESLGCSGFIAKPFTLESLKALLQHQIA